MHFQTSWLRKTDPLVLLYVVCTSREAHSTKRGTRYYSLINIKINVYCVAIRSKADMKPPPPRPIFCL